MARDVAGKEYVVLMADMFGTGYGDKPKTREQLAAGMKAVHSDLAFTVACGNAAYKALMAEADKLGLIDPSKTAAIGYCAGGGFVLEQARAGADFKATVVFHVTNPNPVVPGTPCNIKGRVLAIHGRADPVTPKPMMDALEEELTKAKVDWHVVMFGRGVHSFCDPTANNPAATQYDAKLCRTSYMLMRDFFAETL
jgi:dienelactone hydrolase